MAIAEVNVGTDRAGFARKSTNDEDASLYFATTAELGNFAAAIIDLRRVGVALTSSAN